MEQYTAEAEIERSVERINFSHDKDGFRITALEVSGGSFDLTITGDYPKWQMHLIRYLIDKTDLEQYRDSKGQKTILKYQEMI